LHQVVCPACHYPFPGGKDVGGAAVHHAAEKEDNGVEREVAAGAVSDLVVGDRVEVLVDQPGWVVVLLWKAGGAGVTVGQGDNVEVIIGIGQPRGLGPKQSNDLDVVAPAGLVAEGLKPDSGAGSGGEGLSDDALGTLVQGHTVRLPLKTDLGVPEEVCLTAVGAIGLSFTG
jgi:hypothetical protein